MNRIEKQYRYTRRTTHPVAVGTLTIGGTAPIVVQSMTNVNTNDVEAGVAQAARIVATGGEMVRFTAQGVKEAKSLAAVRAGLNALGIAAPLVADIHFNPQAAVEAALHVEKVRINPGNFYDPARKFKLLEYTDAEYAEELRGLQASFATFLAHCKQHGTALRIGVNHGSLSDRIMSRYGDTPEGMVESCMEFLTVCRKEDFANVVISIKASNVLVMTQTVRLLCQRMQDEGMTYPLHLGVTEAGDGEDGRVKSATGIGSLLADGIGDTIRVSLSEAPEAEIPETLLLRQCVAEQAAAPEVHYVVEEGAHPSAPALLPGYAYPVVMAFAAPDLLGLKGDDAPDLLLSTSPDHPSGETLLFTTTHRLLASPEERSEAAAHEGYVIVEVTHADRPNALKALAEIATFPYIIYIKEEAPASELPVRLGYSLGGALLRGEGAGILLHTPQLSPAASVRLAYGLLQSTRRRITRTEFISCPGCGRTLFDLQETVARVKTATGHLKGLKIGVMGCIVNGPGEMADADYGYVGSSPGAIDLYKGKVCVERKIPQAEAVDRLIDLIRSHGDWVDVE